MSLRSVALFTSLLVAPIFAGPRAMGTWTIDAAASHVTILVGKTGLFGFVGHTHEIHAPRLSGTIAFDRDAPGRSVVHLAFEAGALRVDPEGEPPDDVPEVQRTMLGPEVLDVARYPMISFDSTSVDVRPADAAPDDASTAAPMALDAVVTGDLRLHGVTRSIDVTGPVTVDGDVLRLTGTCRFKQTDFGIEPVTAGLGTVRVKDALEVTLDVVARRDRAAGR